MSEEVEIIEVDREIFLISDDDDSKDVIAINYAEDNKAHICIVLEDEREDLPVIKVNNASPVNNEHNLDDKIMESINLDSDTPNTKASLSERATDSVNNLDSNIYNNKNSPKNRSTRKRRLQPRRQNTKTTRPKTDNVKVKVSKSSIKIENTNEILNASVLENDLNGSNNNGDNQNYTATINELPNCSLNIDPDVAVLKNDLNGSNNNEDNINQNHNATINELPNCSLNIDKLPESINNLEPKCTDTPNTKAYLSDRATDSVNNEKNSPKNKSTRKRRTRARRRNTKNTRTKTNNGKVKVSKSTITIENTNIILNEGVLENDLNDSNNNEDNQNYTATIKELPNCSLNIDTDAAVLENGSNNNGDNIQENHTATINELPNCSLNIDADSNKSSTKRSISYDYSKLKWLKPLNNLSSPPHLQIVIIDRNNPYWRITNDKWLMIEKRLLEALNSEMIRTNDTNIGLFDGAKWQRGIKIVGCHNKNAFNFITKFILSLDKLWSGAKLDVFPITHVTRHVVKVYIPPPTVRTELILSLIQLQNPSIHVQDWKILRECERANDGVDIWFSVNDETFTKLSRFRGEIKYGINRIFFQPSQ